MIFSGLQTIFIPFRGVNGAPKVPSPGECHRHENGLVGSGTGATSLYSPVCVTIDNPALREISEKAPEPKFGGHARVGIGIRIHNHRTHDHGPYSLTMVTSSNGRGGLEDFGVDGMLVFGKMAAVWKKNPTKFGFFCASPVRSCYK